MRSKYLSAFAALCASSLISLDASALPWGADGHAVWGGSVWGDPETQFAAMQKYGLTSYRFDMPLVDDLPSAPQTLQTLVTLAAKYHITLHPVIYIPFNWDDNITDAGRYPATLAGLEEQGYNRVYPIVKQFGSQIQDWELDNEVSLIPGVKSGMGYSPGDYNTTTAQQWAAALKGMSNAIIAVRQETGVNLNTVVDIMYVDFGLIGFLENNGVEVDKVGYHYYYTLNQNPYHIIAPNGQAYDIFAEMNKLGKPIAINEFNAAEIYAPVNNPPEPYNDAQALMSLQEHINYIRNETEVPIEDVEYYELYNDTNPTLNAAESNFGLMLNATTAKTQMLLAAVYSCSALTSSEDSTLISHGLFTTATLASQRASCSAATTASTTSIATTTASAAPVVSTVPAPAPITTAAGHHPHAHHKHPYDFFNHWGA